MTLSQLTENGLEATSVDGAGTAVAAACRAAFFAAFLSLTVAYLSFRLTDENARMLLSGFTFSF